MNTIVCLKWGTLYDYTYVNNLYAMVKRNLTLPFRFVCFTDDPANIHSDIETKSIPSHLEGWWGKTYYFNSPLEDITGTVLALDLDVVIVDNLDCFFTHEPKHFVMKPDHGRNNFSSAVMRFKANQYPHVYRNLDLDNMDYAIDNSDYPAFKSKRYRGDQGWITEQMLKDPNGRKVKLWPNKWIPNYKFHCIREKGTKLLYAKIKGREKGPSEFFVPPQAKIIVFSGYTFNNKNYYEDIKRWWHADDI